MNYPNILDNLYLPLSYNQGKGQDRQLVDLFMAKPSDPRFPSFRQQWLDR